MPLLKIHKMWNCIELGCIFSVSSFIVTVVSSEIKVEESWDGVVELTEQNFDHEINSKPFLVLFYIPK